MNKLISNQNRIFEIFIEIENEWILLIRSFMADFLSGLQSLANEVVRVLLHYRTRISKLLGFVQPVEIGKA